jgi:hypothetical protein
MKFIKVKLKLIWLILVLSQEEWLRVYLKQRAKGFKKYGVYLEDADKSAYDWKEMVYEEVIDAMNYVEIL